MTNDSSLLKSLFAKYTEGTASPEETKQLFELMAEGNVDEEIKGLLRNELNETDVTEDYNKPRWDSVFNKINTEATILENPEQAQRKGLRFAKIAVAASIILCLGIGGYFYSHTKSDQQLAQNKPFKNDIAPGGNKAFLTLSNGKRISLTDVANGGIAEQSGITITKTADGKVVYVVGHSNHNVIANEFNTIETPRGGQYQITLPDGTEVWLNASSSLKYPASFASLKERKVELTGEGYFQVAKDKSHPFIVKTDQQELKVLGTHFNVNAYKDEVATKTTLLEGSVQVTLVSNATNKAGSSRVLKPDEQAILKGDDIQVSSADTELAVAWKNNQFMFDDESIQHIMKMVERWYNVEAIYEGEMPDDKFGGAVSRFDNVSKVLRILETTKKVHFRIEGQKIYVFK